MKNLKLYTTSYLLAFIGLILIQNVHANWKMEHLPNDWHFAGFENSFDISGVAAANGVHCLVGSDESFYVQPGVIDLEKKRIESRRPIALPLKNENDSNLEIDIEGITFSPTEQAYFVVGSHGVGKKKGDFQPERYAVHKLAVDVKTGLVQPKRIQRTSLLPWLEKTPLLAPFIKQQLQANGLNIEGLASRDGKLFFGLRSPSIDGNGFVIEISAKDLFGDAKPKELVVHSLKLGKGRGIREITAAQDGFIVLTGSAGAPATKKIPETLFTDADNSFSLLFWNGTDSQTTFLSDIPSGHGKAEGLLVLDDKPGQVDLLIIYDSLPGGLPTAVRLTRKK